MMRLLIDGTYLARRAFHAIEHLSYRGVSTTVAFGFIRELDNQRHLRLAERVVLAFDYGGAGLRGELMPGYKASRRARHSTKDQPDQIKAEQETDFRAQLKRLRRKILPDLGYRNVVSAKGYEADDIIAAAADSLPEGDEAVIVTADKDMWQCLRPSVSWYSPATKKFVTSESFRDEWGIEPAQWASVKALAGCPTDDVPGIKGIGEKTAAKWFAGTLKAGKAYERIVNDLEVHNRNMPIVKLPFEGLKLPKLHADDLTDKRRREVFSELGFRRV